MTTIPRDGYGVFAGYTRGYFRRLSPTWLRLTAAVNGVPFPEGEALRYFELGFGQGVSLNVHAAANPGEFWGNDYNPKHVGFALQMAEASGANIHLLHDSFEQLAQRRDLPRFNVIVAHGVWSWISEATRSDILRFVDEKLAPGGLFYVSYNALPGSASGIAIQRFLSSVARSMGVELDDNTRFNLARAQLGTIKDQTGGHFDHYPKALDRLEKVLAGTSPYYLHEYLVEAWQPMLLMEVAAELRKVGLEFCGSAHLTTADLRGSQDDCNLKNVLLDETLKDFSVDRAFRSDIFVREDPQKPRARSETTVWDQEVALAALPDDFDLVPVETGDDAIVSQLREKLDVLNRSPLGRARLGALIPGRATEAGQIPEDEMAALANALNAGLFHPVSSNRSPKLVESSSRLNAFLGANLGEEDGRSLYASPVIGSAVKWQKSAITEHEGGIDMDALVSELRAGNARGEKISSAQALRYAVTHEERSRIARQLQIR